VAQAVAREAYAAARRRIAFLEAFVLKLLLIEAARIPHHHPFPGRGAAACPGPMNTSARERGAAQAAHRVHATESMGRGPGAARQSGKGRVEDRANPATWRVRFHARLAPLQPRPDPPTSARLHLRPDPNARQAKALALARRFEALRRIIADPRRAAAALARRLTRLGPRAEHFAHRIALASPRQGGGPTFAEATVFAFDSTARWRPNTS
jgi:hypothetical protein